MKCRGGVKKVSWADRAGTALCRLAGNSEQGRVYFLARHGQLHTFTIFSVLNFERGKEIETALLSIYILWTLSSTGGRLRKGIFCLHLSHASLNNLLNFYRNLS